MSELKDWEKDLNWSNKLFLSDVWPRIKCKCGGGEIKPVEILRDNEIATDLDVLCGIDVWQTIGIEGARGIASRVQNNTNDKYKGKNWGTFTIRYKRVSGSKTEYEKRKEAIDTGRYIYPYLTCQAYFDHGVFIGGGIAKTIDVYNAVDFNNTNKSDNTFLVVPFDTVASIWSF